MHQFQLPYLLFLIKRPADISVSILVILFISFSWNKGLCWGSCYKWGLSLNLVVHSPDNQQLHLGHLKNSEGKGTSCCLKCLWFKEYHNDYGVIQVIHTNINIFRCERYLSIYLAKTYDILNQLHRLFSNSRFADSRLLFSVLWWELRWIPFFLHFPINTSHLAAGGPSKSWRWSCIIFTSFITSSKIGCCCIVQMLFSCVDNTRFTSFSKPQIS